MNKKDLEAKSQMWDKLNVKNNNSKTVKHLKHIYNYKYTIITLH